MKLVRFRPRGPAEEARVGLVIGETVLDPAPSWETHHDAPFPRDPVAVLAGDAREFCERLCAQFAATQAGAAHPGAAHPGAAQPGGRQTGRNAPEPAPLPRRLSEVSLLAPIERPAAFRDFYSFEEHVRRARARRRLEVPPEWYLHPAFYFSHPAVLLGPGEPVRKPSRTRELDFEAEIGCVLLRGGEDLDDAAAEACIGGYVLLNDWSARDLQREEMAVGLGPAKGKDFATSLGPWLVTPEELTPSGKGCDLEISVLRNGRTLGRANWNTIAWSFAEMIAYASRDTRVLAGDLFGSGTIGGGCLLEIGPEAGGGWLVPGDVIGIEAGALGMLESQVKGGE